MNELERLRAENLYLKNQRELNMKKFNDYRLNAEAAIRQLAKERDNYKSKYQVVAKSYKELKENKNPRNAGRKKFDQKWTDRYMKFSYLMEKDKSMEDIMSELNISRATFFRLKKVYRDDLQFGEAK